MIFRRGFFRILKGRLQKESLQNGENMTLTSLPAANQSCFRLGAEFLVAGEFVPELVNQAASGLGVISQIVNHFVQPILTLKVEESKKGPLSSSFPSTLSLREGSVVFQPVRNPARA